MDLTLSYVYLPSAVLLGALHALEPGHAKTLTAAYLIGIRGTRRDAVLLGLSVAVTHSLVVVGLACAGLWIGREAFTEQAMFWLQALSGLVVVILGSWMLWRRLRRRTACLPQAPDAHDHGHGHAHDHGHDHDHGHSHDLPTYALRGERPTPGQIVAFGAAGGLVPCPASVTVMLLALTASQAGLGLLLVAGFSLGLALTLVLIGLAVVAGLSRLSGSGRFAWFSRQAPLLSAGMVIVSGLFALTMAALGDH